MDATASDASDVSLPRGLSPSSSLAPSGISTSKFPEVGNCHSADLCGPFPSVGAKPDPVAGEARGTPAPSFILDSGSGEGLPPSAPSDAPSGTDKFNSPAAAHAPDILIVPPLPIPAPCTVDGQSAVQLLFNQSGVRLQRSVPYESIVAHPERARRDSDGPPPREVQACPFAWVFFVVFVFLIFVAWWALSVSVRTDNKLVDGPSRTHTVLDGAWKQLDVTLHVWCTGMVAQIAGSPFLFMMMTSVLACILSIHDAIFASAASVLQIGFRGARAVQRAPTLPLTVLSIVFGMLHFATAAPVLPSIRTLGGGRSLVIAAPHPAQFWRCVF